MNMFIVELVWLLRKGIPMSFIQIGYGLIMPITMAFCGSLGTEAIDQASLAISIYQIFVLSLESGLRFAVISFSGQIVNTETPERVGIFLQRGILIAASCWCICVSVAFNLANILIFLGQVPSIAVGAEQFMIILLPGCLAIIMYRMLMAYLDVLGVIHFTSILQICFCVVCLPLEYLVVNYTDMGTNGVALVVSMCQCALPLAQIAYMWWSGVHAKTWGGWSARSLSKWGKFLRSAVTNVATISAYFCAVESGTFIAGHIGKNELAAQSISFQIYALVAQLPYGFLAAAMVRITWHIGRRDMTKSKLTTAALCCVLTSLSATVAFVLMVFGDDITSIFSSDQNVHSLVRLVRPYLCFYAFWIFINWTHLATFRAFNENAAILITTIVGFVPVAFAISLPLVFVAGWGLRGLWVSYCVGILVAFILNCLYYFRRDWTKISDAVINDVGKETDVELTGPNSERVPLLKTARKAVAAQRSDSTASFSRTVRLKIILFGFLTCCMVLSAVIRLYIPPLTHISTVQQTTNSSSISKTEPY